MRSLDERLRGIPVGWVDTAIGNEAADAIATLQADNAKLRALLTRCADELAEEIAGKYPDYRLKYPHQRQKMANDMETVDEARAALEDTSCPFCGGFGWVCENHPTEVAFECSRCGGAGMPCVCSPLSREDTSTEVTE